MSGYVEGLRTDTEAAFRRAWLESETERRARFEALSTDEKRLVRERARKLVEWAR